MHCEIAGTQGPLGYVNALGATRFVHWLILVAPSCLRSHNARYIMLKSLNNTCAILSMNVYFDIKRQENILCKNPSDSNARNIILYCEFSNAVVGHAIRTFPGMNEKTQFYVFMSGSRRLCTPRPLEINMETDVLFSYCHERPSDFNHGMQRFGRSFWVRNIYRYVLSTKCLIWSTKAIEVVLVFSETRF